MLELMMSEIFLNPVSWLLLFGSTLMGLIFGAIPGLTATLGVALILPLTFSMTPLQAMLVMGGVYIGGISGGLVSATLINMPGTPSSICTTFDAFPMAKQGKSAEALSIGVFCSFVGGIFSWIVLVTLSPQLAKLALSFAPYEYFWLCVFGLTVIIGMETKQPMKAVLAVLIGLVIALIGIDPVGGMARFTFGNRMLRSGFRQVPVLMGFFVVSEILSSLSEILDKYVFAANGLSKVTLKPLFERGEKKETVKNLASASVIGTFLGILPGVGGATANFITYDVAKKTSKSPEKFGTGYAQGIVASETGNNAVTGGAIIPMLTLGIPGDSVTAVMLSGLMIHGVQVGPLLFTNSADLVWPFFIGILVANVLMVMIQFCGGIKLFTKALRIPKWVLFPLVVMMIFAGTWTLQYSGYDLWTVFIFGFLGYFLKRNKFPMTPVVLGVILGKTMEDYFRRGMILASGDFSVFYTRPACLVLIGMTIVALVISVMFIMKDRKASKAA